MVSTGFRKHSVVQLPPPEVERERERERERELLPGIIGRKVPGVSLGTRCHNNLRFPYSRNKTGTHDLVLVTQMRHYTIFSSQISPEDAHVESGFKCSYQSYSTHTHTHTHTHTILLL